MPPGATTSAPWMTLVVLLRCELFGPLQVQSTPVGSDPGREGRDGEGAGKGTDAVDRPDQGTERKYDGTDGVIRTNVRHKIRDRLQEQRQAPGRREAMPQGPGHEGCRSPCPPRIFLICAH